MSISSATIEFKACRIVGTFEHHNNDGSSEVCQIDLDITPANCATVMAEWPKGYNGLAPHNHYDNVAPRVMEGLQQMAARHRGPVAGLIGWQVINQPD